MIKFKHLLRLLLSSQGLCFCSGFFLSPLLEQVAQPFLSVFISLAFKGLLLKIFNLSWLHFLLAMDFPFLRLVALLLNHFSKEISWLN
jgi:hypothetical protein